MDITPIITALLELVFACFTVVISFVIQRYLVPWLKSKFTESEYATLSDFIAQMIKAAEQCEENGLFDEFEEKGAAKKDYVLKLVKSYCEEKGFTFDEEVVSGMIEGLIKDVKYAD